MACRNNCPNEKPGGLANNIFNSCSFGKKCEFVELQDMMHGFLLEGERSIEAIAVQSRLSMKKAGDFWRNFFTMMESLLPTLLLMVREAEKLRMTLKFCLQSLACILQMISLWFLCLR